MTVPLDSKSKDLTLDLLHGHGFIVS